MAKKEKQIERAQKFVQKGYFDKAISEYKSIVTADPSDISLRLRLGELYVKTGLKEEAIKEYSSIGKYNTTKGFYLKAIAVYKQVIKLDETNLEIHNKLADLYTKQRLIADAIGEYSFILNLYEKKGYSNEAFDLLKKMVSIDEENAGLKLRLADTQKKLGYEDDALDLYCWVFQRFLAKGKTEKAENLLRDLYADSPKDMRVLEGLVKINKERGDVSQFVSHAAELIDSYKECGELEKLEELCESVLEAAPDNEKAKNMLSGLSGEVESGHDSKEDEAEPELEEDEVEILEESETAATGAQDAFAPEEVAAAEVTEDKDEEEPEVEVAVESEEEAEEEVEIEIDEDYEEDSDDEVLEDEVLEDEQEEDEDDELFEVDFDDSEEEEPDAEQEDIDSEEVLPEAAETASETEETEVEQESEEIEESVQAEEPVVEDEVLEDEVLEDEESAEPEAVEVVEEEEDVEAALDSLPESGPGEDEESLSEDVDVDVDSQPESDSVESDIIEDGEVEDVEAEEIEPEETEEVVEVFEEEDEVDHEEIAPEDIEELVEDDDGEITEEQLEEIPLEEIPEEEVISEDPQLLEDIEVEEVLQADDAGDDALEELSPEDMEEVVAPPSQSDPEDVGGAGAVTEAGQDLSEEELSLSGDYTDEVTAEEGVDGEEGSRGGGLIDLTEDLGIEEALEQLVDGWSGGDMVEEFKAGMGEQLSREDVETHFNLGIAYMEMDLFEDAVREFKLSAKDPLFEFNSYARLGQCLVAMGQAIDAVGFYIKGLAVKGMSDTERIGAMYELALAYSQAEKDPEALQMMTAVSDLDPEYREVAEKLVELATVRNYIPVNDNLIEVELL